MPQTKGIQTARLKLISQNHRLYNQITMLQQKMSQVITQDISAAIMKQAVSNSKKDQMPHGQLIIQQNYMKKLKQKILQLKSLINTQTLKHDIVSKQQNQLVALRRQFQNLLGSKHLLSKQFQTRKAALSTNTPLTEYKNETFQEKSKLKKTNAELQAKIVQLQREVRKYHKKHQYHRAYKDQKIVIENPQFQLAKLEHQKHQWDKKASAIQTKWKSHLQTLDNQYFANREIHIRKQKIVSDLEKQIKNWENRTSAVRNQVDVINDRERISKLQQSPSKQQIKIKKFQKTKNVKSKINHNKSLQQIPKDKKQGITGITGITGLIKSLKKQQQFIPALIDKKQQPKYKQVGVFTKQRQQQTRKWDFLTSSQNKKEMSRYGSQSDRIQSSNKKDDPYLTRRSLKNQFLFSKQAFSNKSNNPNMDQLIENQKKKKRMLLMKNIGVGTSFYYNDEED